LCLELFFPSHLAAPLFEPRSGLGHTITMAAKLGLAWPVRSCLYLLLSLCVLAFLCDVEAYPEVELDATAALSSEHGSPSPCSGRCAALHVAVPTAALLDPNLKP
jgi:hypothetical protein